MGLSTLALRLKEALEANGVVVGSTQDQILDAATGFLHEVAARPVVSASPTLSTDESSPPAKPVSRRSKK